MRKKGILLLAALSLLLAGCGEKTQNAAEDLQARYAQISGYEAVVEVAVPREDETLRYTLSLEHSSDETLAALTSMQTGAPSAARKSDAPSLSPASVMEKSARSVSRPSSVSRPTLSRYARGKASSTSGTQLSAETRGESVSASSVSVS